MKLQVDSNFKQPKMRLQVVLKFKRVWNEVISCFQLNLVNNEATRPRMKLQVDSNFKLPKMKLQVVFNFKRVWNEATSSFHPQSSK